MEVKIEFMIKASQYALAEKAIIDNHPYETPVYDFIKMTKLQIMVQNWHFRRCDVINRLCKIWKHELDIPSVRYIQMLINISKSSYHRWCGNWL